MLAINPHLNRTTQLRIQPNRTFRFDHVMFGKRNSSVMFLHGVFENPYWMYNLITEPLEAGTYKFKIVGYDNLDNYNTGVEASATIEDIPYPPLNLTIESVDNNRVILQWDASTDGATVDRYAVYGNGGSGLIDRSHVLATITPPDTTAILDVSAGDWWFVVESVSGNKESINYFTVGASVLVAETPTQVGTYPNNPPVIPDTTPNTPLNVSLNNYSVGRCQITFLWVYDANASHFRIYTDNATGVMDWTNHIARFERQDGEVQQFVTDQLIFVDEDVEYKFGIRAESPDGVVEQNMVVYTVTLDGKAPDNAIHVETEVI